jgi:hypothetical protein
MNATLAVSAVLVGVAQSVSATKMVRDTAMTMDLAEVAYGGRADGLCSAVALSSRDSKLSKLMWKDERKKVGGPWGRSMIVAVGDDKSLWMKMRAAQRGVQQCQHIMNDPNVMASFSVIAISMQLVHFVEALYTHPNSITRKLALSRVGRWHCFNHEYAN